MFDDERKEEHQTAKRCFFSYIGTIAPDHSFKEYVDFVEWALENDELPSMKFLIATKSAFEAPEGLRKSERVVIKQGRPMSNEEINDYYSRFLYTRQLNHDRL